MSARVLVLLGVLGAALALAGLGGSGEVAPSTAGAQRADVDVSPFASPEACAGALDRSPPSGPPRIATWNVRWFPDGRANGELSDGVGTDVAWLACAIASMRVDLVAMQEIVAHERGRRALEELLAELGRLTGARFRATLDRCPEDGRQHVGFLYREDRVTLDEVRVVDALNPGRNGCDHRLRPGLLLHARFAGGGDAHVLTLHLDSGTSARDAGNRARSVERLAELAARLREPDGGRDLLVLGDFNTMGCDRCDLPADGDAERAALVARLASPDVGLERVGPGAACTENDGHHRSVLDHVFARRGMVRPGGAEVVGPCATTCASRASRAPFFRRLSDHCPVVVELDVGGHEQP